MMGDKHKKTVAAILGSDYEEEDKEQEAPEALHAIAEELIECVVAKDAAGVAACLKAAFDEMEAQPHAEGEHTEA